MSPSFAGLLRESDGLLQVKRPAHGWSQSSLLVTFCSHPLPMPNDEGLRWASIHFIVSTSQAKPGRHVLEYLKQERRRPYEVSYLLSGIAS